MDINVSIEVAIGLAVMYLLLALLCTIVNEILATWRGLRAKDLRTGITKLLQDENVKGIAKDFFDTPIIKSISSMAGKHGPSYLASKDFASALVGILQTNATKVELAAPPQGAEEADKQRLTQAVSDLAQTSDAGKVLASFFKEVGNDAEKLQARVAHWYDEAMERWGGNYKRNAQKWSFAIAVIVVVAFNADTFFVAKALWNDPAARSEIADAAQNIAPEELNDPQYSYVREELRKFPLGWQFDQPMSMGGLYWILKLAGLFVSALAVSLGAPFWFEVLNKLNAIRGVGRKPKKASGTP